MFRGGGTPRQRKGSRRPPEVRTFDSPLEELTICLDRMEEMVNKMRGLEVESRSSEVTPLNKNQRGFSFRARRKVPGEPAEEGDQKLDAAPATAVGNNRGGQTPNAKFIIMSPDDEEEMVELIRRIAELVVMGEKAGAQIQSRAEKHRLSNETTSQEDDESNARVDAHIALFETFFERNALDTIVKMVTGAAFDEGQLARKISYNDMASVSENEAKKGSEELTETSESGTEGEINDTGAVLVKPDTKMLPPLVIATQAIQSVSILIQNVSRATSLYFLLSNNYVNDMINLPLEQYAIAERFRRGDRTAPIAQRRQASPEMAELTTHYVTFLKSLALRMNAETLQFFLAYPTEHDSNQKPASSTHFCSFEDLDSVINESERGNVPSSPVSKPVQVGEIQVEFPLFARALEYCAAHQDSFVRVTAMNICLNTLKLATVSPTDSTEVNFDDKASSPDGVLFNAQALPLRERLAIAQHVCAPSRVEALVSPIFTKLAHLWGVLEENIRDIDLLREGVYQKEGGTRVRDSKMEKAKRETQKKRLADSLKDSFADLQDELLLLEDVFKVGLTSLNEQCIEMMLATFVYPLLLQPLLLYMQRYKKPESSSQYDAFMADVLTMGAKTSAGQAGVGNMEAATIEEAAPAKTALFTLGAVFQLLSNEPLMRVLLTALFHPLAPDSSGETMIRAKPDVAGIGSDGKIGIRVDHFIEDASTPIKFEKSPYSFGNVTGRKSVKGESFAQQENGEESCVYVLSPALTEVLEGKAGDLSLIAKTRANPYRRALMKCLAAGPSMSTMRQVAVLLMDAVVTRFDCKFASDIIFGTGLKTFSDDIPLDERNLDSRRAFTKNNRDMGEKNVSASRHTVGGKGGGSFMSEVVTSLCLSVINVSTYYEGMWKLVFDGVAAHSLLLLAKENTKAMQLASREIEKRRRLSSVFVSEVPLHMDIAVGSPNDDDNTDNAEEIRVGLHTHDMFFTSAKGKQFSVVSELLKMKETVGQTETDEYSVSIAVSNKFDDLSTRMCNFGSLQLDDEVKDAVLQVAATSSMAMVQVDALSNFLKELAATNCAALKGNAPSAFTISRSGAIVSTKVAPGTDVNRSIFSPISPRMGRNLLRLDEEMSEREIPAPGSVVGLVGRTAIPCVCEVPESSALLLADQAASVVSDGVKWLSLYLVFLGRYMILAEPERKGSGGNGRVISASHLTRLTLERDALPPSGSSSPARRLLATHVSLDLQPPGLFLVEQMGDPKTFGPFDRLTRNKSTLDIWFEDEGAAEHAFRVMKVKLSRALAKRGNRLREKLAADE